MGRRPLLKPPYRSLAVVQVEADGCWMLCLCGGPPSVFVWHKISVRKQPFLLFVGGNLGPPSAKYVENRIKIDGSTF